MTICPCCKTENWNDEEQYCNECGVRYDYCRECAKTHLDNLDCEDSE